MRHLIFSSLLTVLTGPVPLMLAAQEGSVDETFNPNDLGNGVGDGANSAVNEVVMQPDGRILIIGTFNQYEGVARNNIARVNADGSVDGGFNPGTGASGINCFALQPDGKILIAGDFQSFNGTAIRRIARLNTDGSLDASFNPGTSADEAISSLAIQPDGKILIGGWFTNYNGTPRNFLARLLSNGTLDPNFNTGIGPNNQVGDIALQTDGKIVLSGLFTSFNGTTKNYLCRINTTGSLETAFNSGSGPGVPTVLAIGADGKVLVGGAFTSYDGMPRSRIARLNTDGTLDAAFVPATTNGTTGGEIGLKQILPLADGRVVIGGVFTTVGGSSRKRLARLTATGSLDNTFSTGDGANGKVYGLALQADGKVLISGTFTSYDQHGCRRIARVNTNGSCDETFSAPQYGSNGPTFATPFPNGQTMLYGSFTSYQGSWRNGVARLDADGNVDNTFDPGLGISTGGNIADLYGFAAQPDGKVIIAGEFNAFDGVARDGIARLNPDGGVDPGFDPALTGTGTSPSGTPMPVWVAVQPDGKVIVLGFFSTVNGVASKFVTRLNTDGTTDMTFAPLTSMNFSQTGLAFNSLALQPDGKIIIAGSFASYNGTSVGNIIRLNPDGTVDPTFNTGTGFYGVIEEILLQPDGKILVAGYISTLNGSPCNSIVRLHPDGSLDPSLTTTTPTNGWITEMALQPDGRILIGGRFTAVNGISRNYLARIMNNGSLDVGFVTGPGASSHLADLTLQEDGKVLVMGDFTSYNGTGRNRIARINGTPRAGIKVMLEGPYSGTTMTDVLRNLPSFPLTEPFTALGYAETGYVSGASIGSGVLSVTGNNAIVDWVIVEMRPVATPGTVAASRAVLLQRDGDVVDLDGVSTVGFAGLAAGNYCVAVKPRNHLPVMLSASTPVSYGAAIATVDFTLPTTLVYDNDARKNVSGVMVLATGDVTFNETLSYTGAGNDRDPILTRVGSTTPNNSVSGYWREDVNMDGVVKYTGSANDRDIILTNVGSTTPNNTRVATLP